MKKKLTPLILALVFSLCCAFGFAACGDATGGSGGNNNESGNTQTPGESGGNTNGGGNTNSGGNTNGGGNENESGNTQTPGESGGNTEGGGNVQAHTHSMTHHEATVTCTAAGNIEYWSCSGCEKNFSDEAGEHEVSKIAVSALGHNYKGTYECTRCETVLQYTEGLSYKLNSDGESYYVSGIGEATDSDIVIPYTNEGKPVTRIGDNAFKDCTGLTSIMLLDGFTSIGANAFYKCSGLTSITVPGSLTSIGTFAFWLCSSIESVTYTGDIESWCGISSGLSHLMGFSADTRKLYIGGEEIAGDIVIPDGVTSIGEAAFFYCKEITSITIPDSVTSIGEMAFCYCYGLTSFTIPEGVTRIEKQTFYSCDGLTSFTFPDNVTSIGVAAFRDCNNLRSITIGKGMKTIEEEAFRFSEVEDVYYMGTQEEWNQISIGEYNAEVKYGKKYFYVEKSADVPADGGLYWHYVDGVPTAWESKA